MGPVITMKAGNYRALLYTSEIKPKVNSKIVIMKEYKDPASLSYEETISLVGDETVIDMPTIVMDFFRTKEITDKIEFIYHAK